MTYLFRIFAGFRCSPEDINPARIKKALIGVVLSAIYIVLVRLIFKKYRNLKAFPVLASGVLFIVAIVTYAVITFFVIPWGC